MVHRFFQEIRDGLLLQQELTKIAEHRALEDVKSLASRAFRRPVLDSEYSALLTLYKKLREDGQSVAAAVRGLLITVLMSPSFSYHQTSLNGMDGVQPLDNYDVASRLSFFLWSSIPDAVLLESAASGKLQDDSELRAQVRRMLKDPKIESFAREFLGQWLRYRDYLEKDPILADAFPGYSDELRSAIFDQPTHLATYLIQKDLPITELLSSDLTFVNAALAKHYVGELETGSQVGFYEGRGRNRPGPFVHHVGERAMDSLK